MKKLLLVAALVGLLVLASVTVAMAAPDTAGRGPGAGIHAPGTGMANGNMPGRGMMRQQGSTEQCAGNCGAGQRGGAPAWAGQPDAVEKLLNMTDEEIRAERQSGKSLAQIAAEKDVTKDQLVKAILAAKKAILDEQVKAGNLTQAQADAMYSRMQQQVPVMVDRTATGPANGQQGAGQGAGRMGGRGMGGRWSK